MCGVRGLTEFYAIRDLTASLPTFAAAAKVGHPDSVFELAWANSERKALRSTS